MIIPQSKLVDRGEEIIYVYPEVRITDDRDNMLYAASDDPYAVRATLTAARQSASDLIGQVEIGNVTGIVRNFKGGSWAKVLRNIRGFWEEWDVVTQPHLSTGASRAARHWEFELRSTNGLGNELRVLPPEAPYR